MEEGQPTAAPGADATGKKRNPWLWVPSLYFSQGVPFVIVMTMSVIMYKRLGISNTRITLYTSLLYLPWTIKPLWSPLVDITRTKRFWVVLMQFSIAVALGLAAISISTAHFFTASLCVFYLMALCSATHDIAADGFYMLSMSKHEQAWWVGVRSTFYRTAMIVGSGLLVVLAGVLESKNGLPPLRVPVSAVNTTNTGQVLNIDETGPLHLIASPADVPIPMVEMTKADAKTIIDAANQSNRKNGFLPELEAPAQKSDGKNSFSGLIDGFGNFLGKHFPRDTNPVPSRAGNVGAFNVTLSQPPPAGKAITVNVDRTKSGIEYLGLGKGDKGFRLVEGEQFNFNATNWNLPARVVIQLDPKLKNPTAVQFMASSGNIPKAWTITLFVVTALFLGFSIWHSVVLPRPVNDGPVLGNRGMMGEFFATFGAFFRKPGVGMAMAFILLYRFDEAQLGKVFQPFLLDVREGGGLGLTTSQVGIAYGTFGIAALTGGGILGGFAAAKYGLKRMLPFMVAAMYLPKLVFIFLSFTQPENFLGICGAVAVEQFGYGLGFTAFMLYMLYFADGPHKTAHYAICTGFMALGMMIPGMWSGWLVDHIGYRHFFIWVICSALPGLFIALNLRVDPNFGKK